MDTKTGDEGVMFNPIFRRSAVLRALFGRMGGNGPERDRRSFHDRCSPPACRVAAEDNPEEGEHDGEKGFPRTIDA